MSDDKFLNQELTLSDVNTYLKNLFSFMFLQKLIVYFSVNYFTQAGNVALFATSISMIALLLITMAVSPRLMSIEPRPTFAYLLFTLALCFILNQNSAQQLLGLIIVDFIVSMVVYSGNRSSRTEIITSIFIVIIGCPLVAYALSQDFSRALIYALYSAFLLLGVVVRLRRSLEIIQVSYAKDKPER